MEDLGEGNLKSLNSGEAMKQELDNGEHLY